MFSRRRVTYVFKRANCWLPRYERHQFVSIWQEVITKHVMPHQHGFQMHTFTTMVCTVADYICIFLFGGWWWHMVMEGHCQHNASSDMAFFWKPSPPFLLSVCHLAMDMLSLFFGPSVREVAPMGWLNYQDKMCHFFKICNRNVLIIFDVWFDTFFV